jgi:amino acid adenylation domain-containing protein/non-ribosomal peptide synthase protein (TIGR01720 family)
MNLASAPQLSLPYERRRPGATPEPTPATPAPAAFALEFSPGVAERLGRVCGELGVAPDAFLLACWKTLLWRLTGQSELVVGVLFENRKYEELQDALGLFAKCLPVRSELAGEESFRAALRRVEQEMRAAEAWQEYFLWEEHAPAAAAGQPFFPVCFGYEELPAPREARGVRFAVSRLTCRSERYHLKLSCRGGGATLSAEWQYDPDAYTPEGVRQAARCFGTLVESALDDPDAKIAALEVLDESDRRQVLVSFNRTAADYPRDKSVHQLFEEQAERTPDAVAVVAGERRQTYAQLNASANRLAHYLRGRGVGPNAPVGLCVDRSVEMVAALLGILKAGGAYVPFEPEHPESRLALQTAESGIRVLVTQEKHAGRFAGFAGEVIRLDGEPSTLAGEPTGNPARLASPRDAAYVIHTSGSTGTPKGVSVSHQNLVNYTTFICRELGLGRTTPDDQPHFATVSTISADLGNTCLFPSLVSGGCLHVLSYEVVADGERFAEYLLRRPVDFLKIVPSHLSALLESLKLKGVFVRRCLILGGEALSDELVRRISEISGGCRVMNHYGPTETTVGSLTYTLGEDARRPAGSAGVPIGRPIANTRVYILNECLKPVPVGVVGELYIGGDGVSQGYLRRPDETALRFVPDPFGGDPPARLYKTGDLARHLPDGNVEFLGRNDHQVKIRGFRVELGEIEAALNAHEGLRESKVLAREDEAGQKRLVAYCVAGRAAAPSAGELRGFLQRRLPEYMLPSFFIFLKSLPMTPNGKIDLRELPEPGHSRLGADREYVAARGGTEELLARIWGEVLGVEEVGADDNFFELGGDSILSIQVVARANRAGLGLTPKQLFDHPTVAALAEVVAAVRPQAHAEQSVVTGDVPLTPIQRWFFGREIPRPDHFNQAVLLSAERPLDARTLREVLRRLLAQHDALRMRFSRAGGGWRQTNTGDDAPPFTHFDLSALDERDQPGAVERAADAMQRSLNLSEGPLLRCAYFSLGEGRPGRLLLIIHHLVVDGVSWRILLEDLQTAYEQAERGEQISLGAKTTSFKEWATRLAEHARSPELRREAAYWLADGRTDVAPIPLDGEAAADTAASSRTLTVTLDEAETRALIAELPGVYHTQVNDVLLTALAQAFARWGGRRKLLVDMEGHGREPIVEGLDVTRTVGWFTTHFPVLLDLGGDAKPVEELNRIKEQLRAVPNRGIGYGLLRYLSDDEETARGLLAARRPEVSFNYLGQFDRVLDDASAFSPAPESGGRSHDDREPPSHRLRFNASVTGGRLRISLTYGERAHRHETAARLADEYLSALRSLVAHARSGASAPQLPSDFPLAEVSRKELGRVLAQLSGGGDEAAAEGGRQLEDLYPLSPMQEGMLFQSLSDPASDAYFRQYCFALHGALDRDAFARAWREVVGRHPTLRTSFHWEGLEKPLQAVSSRVALPLEEHDWRHLPPGEQAKMLETLLSAEQRRGIPLSRAPLMRLVLARTDDHVHQFVWSYHHLLIDGWSRSLIHREVLTLYEAYAAGGRAELEARRPYRDYIAWLRRKDGSEAEAFWRETLKGFTAPNSLPGGRAPAATPAAGETNGLLRTQLSVEATDALLAGARRHRLTPNTLAQGAWALRLSQLSGESDVVFGTVVSGRPVELVGSEAMMGLFINTLPVRVRVSGEETALAWLERLQARQSELRVYEHSSLFDVQRWSEVAPGRPLFESTLSFGNFWVEASLHEPGASLEMRDIRFTERMHQALVLSVMPGPAWTLQLLYDSRRFDAATAAAILGGVEALLGELAARPSLTLAQLLPPAGASDASGEPPAGLQDAADAEAEFVF